MQGFNSLQLKIIHMPQRHILGWLVLSPNNSLQDTWSKDRSIWNKAAVRWVCAVHTVNRQNWNSTGLEELSSGHGPACWTAHMPLVYDWWPLLAYLQMREILQGCGSLENSFSTFYPLIHSETLHQIFSHLLAFAKTVKHRIFCTPILPSLLSLFLSGVDCVCLGVGLWGGV